MKFQDIIMTVGVAVGITAALFIEACRGDERGTDDRTKSGSCETICEKYELCFSDETDLLECIENCEQDLGWSAAACSEVAQCADEDTCDEMQGPDGWEEYWEDCLHVSMTDIRPGKVTTQFCGEFASALDNCFDDDQSEVQRECEDHAKWFSVDYLDAQSACLTESCDNMEDCLEDGMDRFRTHAELEDLFPNDDDFYDD